MKKNNFEMIWLSILMVIISSFFGVAYFLCNDKSWFMCIFPSFFAYLYGYISYTVGKSVEKEKRIQAKLDSEKTEEEPPETVTYACSDLIDRGLLIVGGFEDAASRFKQRLIDNELDGTHLIPYIKKEYHKGTKVTNCEYYVSLVYKDSTDEDFEYKYFNSQSLFNRLELMSMETKILSLIDKTTLGNFEQLATGAEVWTFNSGNLNFIFYTKTDNINFVDSEGNILGKGYLNPVQYNTLIDARQTLEYFNELTKLKDILEVDISNKEADVDYIRNKFDK